MKRKYFTLIASVVAILVFVTYGFSEIYRWVDEKGQEHITDYPAPTQKKEKLKPIEPLPEVKVKDEPVAIKEPIKEPVKEALKPKPQPKVEIQNKPLPSKQLVIPVKNVPETKPVEPKAIQPSLVEKGKISEVINKIVAGAKDIFSKYGLILAVSLSVYILCSLGLFLIARKLGVALAWLSLIPIAQIWILVSSIKEAFSRRGITKQSKEEETLEGSPFDEKSEEEDLFGEKSTEKDLFGSEDKPKDSPFDEKSMEEDIFGEDKPEDKI
ncbi:MAG: DUF4124 domain-containing protein [Nitrospirae bacterium]|nr:DUF4124 domain-containing protein [Nitrospirota bacterium]